MNLNLIPQFFLLFFFTSLLTSEISLATQNQRNMIEEALYQMAIEASEFVRDEVSNSNYNSCRIIIMSLDFPDHLSQSLDNYDTISQNEFDTLKQKFVEFKSTWNGCLEKSFQSLSEDQRALLTFIRITRETLHNNSEGESPFTLLRRVEAIVLFNNTRCIIESNPYFWDIQSTFQMFVNSRDPYVKGALILKAQGETTLLETRWAECVNR